MFRIPTITRNLLIINLIMYLLTEVIVRTAHLDLNDIFGLHFILAQGFLPHQLFTYMFMHGGLYHLFVNMFALWMFGCVVERAWGSKRFLLYYILCGLGAGLFQEAAQLVQYFADWNQYSFFRVRIDDVLTVLNKQEFLSTLTTVGASGSIYGVLLAFAMTFPEERIFVIPIPVPIKAKWFVCIYAAIELYMSIQTSGDGVAHIAHLGGMVIGYFLIRYWRKHPQAGMGIGSGKGFFNFGRKKKNPFNGNFNSTTYSNPDWNYNARKRAEQEEIDIILDKIRHSGYDSLTQEEKKKLFDASSRK